MEVGSWDTCLEPSWSTGFVLAGWAFSAFQRMDLQSSWRCLQKEGFQGWSFLGYRGHLNRSFSLRRLGKEIKVCCEALLPEGVGMNFSRPVRGDIVMNNLWRGRS